MAQKVYNIGVEATMDVIGGKWKPIILCNLRHGALRPSELRQKIPEISQKMLTQQLRELEAANIVARRSYIFSSSSSSSLSLYNELFSL